MNKLQATLLRGHIDHDLGPGYYVAQSGTPAYHQVLAAAAEGAVDLVGERYVESGAGLSKVVTVALRGGPAMARKNPSIGIGREFFVSAIKDYREWEVKWWREVVQNSVDAGANKISLDAEKQPDGTWLVSCEDNGGGMTEDILVTKFLVLGGSTKTSDSGTAGGFGKAKELIILPWISWEIHSQDVLIRGAGADYTIEKATSFLRGTRLSVVMPPDQHTAVHHAISFVEKCYLPGVKFLIDGEAYRAKLNATKIIDSVPGKLDVYHVAKKGRESNGIHIRANGLFMFKLGYQPVEGFIVAEITAPSIEILTANRDGFRDVAVRRALDNLGTKIAKDVKSALRAKKGIIRKKFINKGKFVGAQQREAEALASVHSLVPNKSGRLDSGSLNSLVEVIVGTDRINHVLSVDSLGEGIEHPGDRYSREDQEGILKGLLFEDMLATGSLDESDRSFFKNQVSLEETIEVAQEQGVNFSRLNSLRAQSEKAALAMSGKQAEAIHSVSSPQAGTTRAIMGSVSLSGVSQVETAIKQLVWEPDFFLCNNVEGWKPGKRFYPEGLTPRLNKLARVWTELCRYVLIQLNCDLPFGVGWIFEDSTAAAYQGEDPDASYAYFSPRGEHWLLLNPFKSLDPRKAGFYSPSKTEDLKILFALAIHEATHMANGITYHDEAFTSALTYNMAACADGFKHARKVASSVKMHSQAKADRW